MEKAELIITALQQRIGEIVSHYETQIAVLRAELTQIADNQQANNDKQQAVEDYQAELQSKLENK